jgi:hypothetical protein
MREGCAWMMDRLLLGGGMELGWFPLVCAVYVLPLLLGWFDH